MVVELPVPVRPLPAGGRTKTWARRERDSWRWCRVYHRGDHVPTGHTSRTYGPLARFDVQRPDEFGRPRHDPDDRSVLYIGADLATSLCEVFGEVGQASLCPRWRVAVLAPTRPLTLFDLTAPGAAMAIGALPALADAALPRTLTQSWARAIYEDQPTRTPVTGIRYRSAYNGGISLAVWNTGNDVQTVRDSRGQLADVALLDAAMFRRFTVEATKRRIVVERIDSRDCPRC